MTTRHLHRFLTASGRLLIFRELTTFRGMANINVRVTKKLDEKAASDILQNVDNFIFDCDGVIWLGNDPIAGCSDVVQRLLKMGKRVYYATNNSSKTRAQIVEKCKRMGYPAVDDNIIGTAYCAALYLKSIDFKGKVYLVGNPSMGKEMDALGIKHTGLGADNMSESEGFDDVVKVHESWIPDPEVNCVLVGFDPHLSLKKITKAATYARNPKNRFLATNEDPFLPLKGDLVIPGTGSIVYSVKIPARREPFIIGKPATTMFDLLHEEHKLEANRTMMVGDSLGTDIAMAGNCGLRSLLVLTGVDNMGAVEKIQASSDTELHKRIPEYYTECLSDLDWTKLKEVADDNEYWMQFEMKPSNLVGNIMEKGEIAC